MVGRREKMTGDKSDNIPGVEKCGPKTAAKWLNEYGTAEGVVEHGDDIKGKIGESLRDNVDSLRLSKTLAAIKMDVDLDVEIDDLNQGEGDIDALRKLYGRYELRSLLRQLDEDGGPAPEPVAAEDTEKSY